MVEKYSAAVAKQQEVEVDRIEKFSRGRFRGPGEGPDKTGDNRLVETADAIVKHMEQQKRMEGLSQISGSSGLSRSYELNFPPLCFDNAIWQAEYHKTSKKSKSRKPKTKSPSCQEEKVPQEAGKQNSTQKKIKTHNNKTIRRISLKITPNEVFQRNRQARELYYFNHLQIQLTEDTWPHFEVVIESCGNRVDIFVHGSRLWSNVHLPTLTECYKISFPAPESDDGITGNSDVGITDSDAERSSRQDAIEQSFRFHQKYSSTSSKHVDQIRSLLQTWISGEIQVPENDVQRGSSSCTQNGVQRGDGNFSSQTQKQSHDSLPPSCREDKISRKVVDVREQVRQKFRQIRSQMVQKIEQSLHIESEYARRQARKGKVDWRTIASQEGKSHFGIGGNAGNGGEMPDRNLESEMGGNPRNGDREMEQSPTEQKLSQRKVLFGGRKIVWKGELEEVHGGFGAQQFKNIESQRKEIERFPVSFSSGREKVAKEEGLGKKEEENGFEEGNGFEGENDEEPPKESSQKSPEKDDKTGKSKPGKRWSSKQKQGLAAFEEHLKNKLNEKREHLEEHPERLFQHFCFFESPNVPMLPVDSETGIEIPSRVFVAELPKIPSQTGNPDGGKKPIWRVMLEPGRPGKNDSSVPGSQSEEKHASLFLEREEKHASLVLFCDVPEHFDGMDVEDLLEIRRQRKKVVAEMSGTCSRKGGWASPEEREAFERQQDALEEIRLVENHSKMRFQFHIFEGPGDTSISGKQEGSGGSSEGSSEIYVKFSCSRTGTLHDIRFGSKPPTRFESPMLQYWHNVVGGGRDRGERPQILSASLGNANQILQLLNEIGNGLLTVCRRSQFFGVQKIEHVNSGKREGQHGKAGFEGKREGEMGDVEKDGDRETGKKEAQRLERGGSETGKSSPQADYQAQLLAKLKSSAWGLQCAKQETCHSLKCVEDGCMWEQKYIGLDMGRVLRGKMEFSEGPTDLEPHIEPHIVLPHILEREVAHREFARHKHGDILKESLRFVEVQRRNGKQIPHCITREMRSISEGVVWDTRKIGFKPNDIDIKRRERRQSEESSGTLPVVLQGKDTMKSSPNRGGFLPTPLGSNPDQTPIEKGRDGNRQNHDPFACFMSDSSRKASPSRTSRVSPTESDGDLQRSELRGSESSTEFSTSAFPKVSTISGILNDLRDRVSSEAGASTFIGKFVSVVNPEALTQYAFENRWV